MAQSILIDRLLGATRPSLATARDVETIEATPFRDRISTASTYAAIKAGAAHQPDAPALQFLPDADPDEPALTLSHAQFFAKLTQSANLFSALGVGAHDVVSFLLPLVPQYFYGLFGAEAVGIANPVNSLLEPQQLAEILQAANTKVLVALGPMTGSDIWEKVESIKHLVPSLRTIVQVNPSGIQTGLAGSPLQVLDFEVALQAQPSDRLISSRVIAPDDIAAYFHTGGTTGTPKLVRHTHENQVYQAWVCNLMLMGQPGGSILFGLPLYHVGGALTQGLTSLINGGCIVVLSASGWRNPSAVRNLWKLVERFKPRVFGGVPTVLAAASAIPVGEADTSSIFAISGGGSAIPVAVAQALQTRFNVPVLEVYGMTETASVHTISYIDRELRLGSVGQPVPYSRVRIVRIDTDGKYLGDCASNEIGVVAMAGPGVFGGYLNDVHNKGAFVEPGWVNSGDLGRSDEHGYIWITGRAKDLIIRGGHNIDPGPIEEILYQHEAVGLAAIIGQPDAYAGELPLAYVQLKPGAKTTAAELHDYVRRKTPERAAVPVAVRLVDAIPLTGVGKVFKPQLRWDATQAVFDETLRPLKDSGIQYRVDVGADGTHGTLATITLLAASLSGDLSKDKPSDVEKRDVEAKIQSFLSPFVTRHQIVWAPVTQSSH
jgi:fatty-acyl-CoA synthase